MIETPAFKAHFRVVPVEGEGVLLLSEGGAFLLRDRRAHVARLIDGRRTAEEIVRALASSLEPAYAWSALMELEANGYITEHRAAANRGETVFWSTLAVDPAAAAAALGAAQVRVFGASSALAERFGAALRGFAIAAPTCDLIESIETSAQPDSPSGLDVVLADDYLSDALLRIHEVSRAARRRWLLVRPAGTEIWLGPLFAPGAAPCLHCLRRRLRHLRPAHRMAARHDPAGGTAEPLGSLGGTEDLACLMAATEVAKLLAGAGAPPTGVIRTIGLQDWSFRAHRLVGHPACGVCGSGSQSRLVPVPVSLQPRPVAFDGDGGYRTVTPHETLRAYEHLVSPLTGIIGGLCSGTHAPDVGRTCVAADIAKVEPTSMSRLAASFRSSSLGKGMTDAQARASALCEAVEHYSARLHGTEATRPGTWRELQGDAIHPNAVMNFSDGQYRNRAAWNARHLSSFHFVPERLRDDDTIDWTPLWSLTERRHKLLPTNLLYYDQTRKLEGRGGFGCSNGCAAGNTLEEAVLQGFLELVERDAVAIWWYNRLRLPAIDLQSFGDRWLSGIERRHRDIGREVITLDLTTDLGIPVVAAFSYRAQGTEERIAIGYGCHLEARIAAQRALTELCQMLNLDLHGDEMAMDQFGDGWMRWATRREQPYLTPDESAPPRTRDDFPNLGRGDLLDNIEFCRATVEERGMEMLVLDQTRADTGMPVAKVVVPGLRHFWPRFGAGRLYDVPVALGWRKAPCRESDLNPIPVFF